MIKARSLFAAVAATTIILAGCSAESTDYKKAAQDAINKEDAWDDADCVKPESTDVGTTFPCTATVKADGSTANFIATIDKKSSVLVQPTLGDETTDTVVDDGTTETSVADDGTTETTEA